MQLFSNYRHCASALILALVNLSLADDDGSSSSSSGSRALIPYLSGTPNLTILYGWEPDCLSGPFTCLRSNLLAGACYNLRSAAPGGSPQLFNNLNSWYGMGNPNPSAGAPVSFFTCQLYASAECLLLIASYSFDVATVSPSIASRAQSIRCGNWASDPALNTDHLIVVGKFRHCNNNWLGGSCLNVYPVLSRCCEKLKRYVLDNFLRSPSEIVSVISDQGMYCYLYDGRGCAGIMVGIPIAQLMNVADLNFTGIAKSFMCLGGI